MAEKKTTGRGGAPAVAKEPTKAQLQRRMEEAREDISQTVEEIKDTVTESYESVKETVSDALDWREQFRKHSVAWSLGALTVGYIVGNGIAASLHDATPQKKGRKSSGLLDEVYALGERLSDEFSDVAQTVLLPALSKKIKDTFGIDLSERLHALSPAKRTTGTSSKRTTKKSTAKKASGKKSSAKKSTAAKRAAKKSK
ncbi:MAG: hypothetical protein QOH25_1269 [Acidobacteriota bacterium]|jgi:hypothetical protein|nr:hypothetical protein [Acidobacteriota bacterium]